MRILIPLAGSSKEFEEQGYNYPKHLIEIAGKPIIQHVIERINTFPESEYIFIIQNVESERFHLENVLKLLIPDCKVITLSGMTQGAACSALCAIEQINDDQPLLIYNGDIIIEHNLEKIVQDFQSRDLDGGIVTFNSVHPRWSYVRLDNNNMVIEAAEKRPISKQATAGIYYYKKGKDFVQSAKNMIKKNAQIGGLFYICPAYNEMILKQAKIGIYEISRDKYFSLSTHQEVTSYSQYYEEKQKRILTE